MSGLFSLYYCVIASSRSIWSMSAFNSIASSAKSLCCIILAYLRFRFLKRVCKYTVFSLYSIYLHLLTFSINQEGLVPNSFPPSHQILVNGLPFWDSTHAGSRLIQLPPVCLLCLSFNRT